MKLSVDKNINLQLIEIHHSELIFKLVDKNRDYLREFMSFVDKMNTLAFAQGFVKNTIQKNKDGIEYAFLILDKDTPIGRIGVYKIDLQNKIAEIGYWIDEEFQNRGIITRSCKTLITYCFDEINLNRIEIKCHIENVKSQKVPERLGFKKEGVLRQAEYLQGKFTDLILYSYCKSDFEKV